MLHTFSGPDSGGSSGSWEPLNNFKVGSNGSWEPLNNFKVNRMTADILVNYCELLGT